LKYDAWRTVRGLSQAPPTLKMVAELKEMLQMTAYNYSGSYIEKAVNSFQSD